jgi:hypothetical protein
MVVLITYSSVHVEAYLLGFHFLITVLILIIKTEM